jgi:hypothetical protein
MAASGRFEQRSLGEGNISPITGILTQKEPDMADTLELYHHGSSICAAKVRFYLA